MINVLIKLVCVTAVLFVCAVLAYAGMTSGTSHGIEFAALVLAVGAIVICKIATGKALGVMTVLDSVESK